MKENLLYNKKIAITGGLRKFSRKNAYNKIIKLGGFPVNHVNNSTDILIIADEIRQLELSTEKLGKFIDLKSSGSDIQGMSEDYFYKLIKA